MLSGAYKYVYEFLWGPICPRGDFICDIIGKPAVPEKLCAIIAKIEDTTGIPPIVSGPVVVGATGYIGYQIYKKKYGATDPLDLIRKIIEKEFGVGSVADKIFQTFVHEIESSVERSLQEFKRKYGANTQDLSIQQKAEYLKKTKQQIGEQTAAALPAHLQEKRDQFQVPAHQLSNLDKIRYVDYRVAYNIPKDQLAPCVMVPVDGSGRPIEIPSSLKLAPGEQGAPLSVIQEQASARVSMLQEQAHAQLRQLAHVIVCPEESASLRFHY